MLLGPCTGQPKVESRPAPMPTETRCESTERGGGADEELAWTFKGHTADL